VAEHFGDEIESGSLQASRCCLYLRSIGFVGEMPEQTNAGSNAAIRLMLLYSAVRRRLASASDVSRRAEATTPRRRARSEARNRP